MLLEINAEVCKAIVFQSNKMQVKIDHSKQELDFEQCFFCGFQSKQASSAVGSESGSRPSSVIQPSPSRSSVSDSSGQSYSLVAGSCPHCNHNVLSLNTSSVLEDCADEGVFSLGNTGILALGSPDKTSLESSRRNSETGLDGKNIQNSSSEEELDHIGKKFSSLPENVDCDGYKSTARRFDLNPDTIRNFLHKEAQMDVNAQWRDYTSGGRPADRSRTQSILINESKDRAKSLLEDINARFEHSGSTKRSDSQLAEQDTSAIVGNIQNSAVASHPPKGSTRRKLKNPFVKSGSIAQDTAEFLSNTGSSFIRVTNRVSSLTRKGLRKLGLLSVVFITLTLFD